MTYTLRVLTQLAGQSTIASFVKFIRDKGDNKLKILAGGGVTEDNIKELVDRTGVREVHGSFRVAQACSTVYKKPGVFMGASKENTQESEFTIKVAGAQRVVR